MDWLRRKITAIQNESYATRLKILRNTVIIIAIILIVVWILTLNHRGNSGNSDPSAPGKFQPIWENLKNLYEKK